VVERDPRRPPRGRDDRDRVPSPPHRTPGAGAPLVAHRRAGRGRPGRARTQARGRVAGDRRARSRGGRRRARPRRARPGRASGRHRGHGRLVVARRRCAAVLRRDGAAAAVHGWSTRGDWSRTTIRSASAAPTARRAAPRR
jgi:hypothetical protein